MKSSDVPGRMEFETKFEDEKCHVLNQSLGTVQKGMEEAQVLKVAYLCFQPSNVYITPSTLAA